MPRVEIQQLSQYQARVLLIAHQAQSPELAFTDIGNQPEEIRDNLLGARQTLEKMGFIQMTENTITITPEGEQILQQEGLLDEMGQVTEQGQEILDAQSKEMGPPGPSTGPDSPTGAEQAPVAAGGEMETTPGDMGFPAEGSIFRQVNDLAKLQS